MGPLADRSVRIGQGKAAWVVASVAALVVLCFGAPAASAAPSCVPAGTNIVCSFTTLGPDNFTVPSGVTQVTLDAFGAEGGGAPPFSAGGLGGEGLSTVAVTPGQTLQVNVGGAGGDRGSALPNGGANGGGTGGTGNGALGGSGGGGASDVRTGSFTLAERIVVGGGGGGGGTFAGGAGGGTTGGTQTAGSDPAAHGTGGTQSAGGTGGTLSGVPSGADGASGTGGAGGDQPANPVAGSGGGGGYFGGGGGAASTGGLRGSGGGGSGFGTTLNSGVRSGNGLVTITYPGAQLRVVKSLSPVGDPGRFNLQIDGITRAPDVGDGGNTGLLTVDPGTRPVGETAGTSTSLGDYTSAIACKDNDGAGATVASGSGAALNVPVSSGAQIACTITNTRQTGQLRVVKNLAPAGDTGRFNLQIDGATRAANVGDGGNTGLQTFNTGTHTVGETAVAPASLADYTTDIVCRADDGAGAIVASGSTSGPLNVPVPGNAQIACLVTNTSQDPPPPDPDPAPPPTPPTPEIMITGLERDREAGTATLTVAANLAGNLSVAKTNKVKGFGPASLTEPGSAELEIVLRDRDAEKLARTGRLTVNPRVLFASDAGEIGIRHQFDLRQD